MKKEIEYHGHGGSYGDGNSHYWSVDSVLNLNNGTFIGIREDSYGGQLAGNSQFSHKVDTDKTTDKAIPFTTDQEQRIYNTLLPLIELTKKYPHLKTFRFFSQKHRYFIEGRTNKARKIAKENDSHYYGVNCLHNIWVLPSFNIVINFYSHYKESVWKVSVESLDVQ